ncbi:MAG: ATP-binding protein [Chitinophagales bacterium]
MRKRIFLLSSIPLVIIWITSMIHERPVQNGIPLNRGWKFHAGDNREWVKPEFDDSNWADINPMGDIHDSFPLFKQAGIGWLRLKIPNDSIGKEIPMAITIQQSVASDIYLNGKLLKKFGVVSDIPAKVSVYDPLSMPLAIPLTNDTVQTFAIRVAVSQGTLYSTIFEMSNPLLSFHLLPLETAVNNYHNSNINRTGMEFSLLGLSVFLLILHISFFALYPVQKANSYFALYAFTSAIAYGLQLKYFLFTHFVPIKFFLGNIIFLLFILSNLFVLVSLHKFLERKYDFFFKLILILSLVAVFLDAFPYGFGWRVGGPIIQLLIQIYVGRIAYLSIKANQKGAWIIALGTIYTFAFFASFILQGTFTSNSFVESLSVGRTILYILYALSFPASISVFLAADFAFTNRVLNQKIKENNELADKNLTQQKEKQQLLSSMNQQLEVQVKERTEDLRKSLEDLKRTQSQLIQSEKMASLGELTAGIAHEIQNPLNFVNNFSELNNELLDEMQSAYSKGELKEGARLGSDIKQNLDKINFHGKRADAIVKSMLMHSRTNTAQQEPTDVNALADEYLRLSYHGTRAKEKNFNANFETNFDPQAGKINMIPQDIGRVFLNLFNNAFYSVHQKAVISDKTYLPLITVSTKRMQHSLEIRIKDNGMGIPENIAGKIFQPFFTTKPTGQGTGLGLSISYDIIKAHGGEIKFESGSSEGTVFIIQLPIV